MSTLSSGQFRQPPNQPLQAQNAAQGDQHPFQPFFVFFRLGGQRNRLRAADVLEPIDQRRRGRSRSRRPTGRRNSRPRVFSAISRSKAALRCGFSSSNLGTTPRKVWCSVSSGGLRHEQLQAVLARPQHGQFDDEPSLPRLGSAGINIVCRSMPSRVTYSVTLGEVSGCKREFFNCARTSTRTAHVVAVAIDRQRAAGRLAAEVLLGHEADASWSRTGRTRPDRAAAAARSRRCPGTRPARRCSGARPCRSAAGRPAAVRESPKRASTRGARLLVADGAEAVNAAETATRSPAKRWPSRPARDRPLAAPRA